MLIKINLMLISINIMLIFRRPFQGAHSNKFPQVDVLQNQHEVDFLFLYK